MLIEIKNPPLNHMHFSFALQKFQNNNRIGVRLVSKLYTRSDSKKSSIQNFTEAFLRFRGNVFYF